MIDTTYRVLARKYRPQKFDDLIGQDVLVRTLTNAFASGRIAHAFLLTGIRGIGKTTTARIIARGLNCIGPDGNGEPTTSPCGVCANCKMILEDRHVDVIEMDAASRTGVDDIREIIDTVHYAPTSGRYKVYIIDEVHMLSKHAFNALLKTLEEPPAHVKFIFATTELRKIPVTILSRCQRFDLRRIELDTLTDHLANICKKESVRADEETLKLIAMAAEGSVRDSLSLLDQAIALGTEADGEVQFSCEQVRDMLGIADKTSLFALMEHIFSGQPKDALEEMKRLYDNGADPVFVLGDMLALTHFITRIKLVPALADNATYSDIEQKKATTLADKLDMPSLTRMWQMLLKGIDETKQAANPMSAAEMIIIRLCYASSLPTPEELVRTLDKQTSGSASTQNSTPSIPQGNTASSPSLFTTAQVGQSVGSAAPAETAPVMTHGNLALATQQTPELTPAPTPAVQEDALPDIESFIDAAELFKQHKEIILYSHLYNDVGLISFAKGMITLKPLTHLSSDIPARLGRHLSDWTGKRWIVRLSEETGEPSLAEQNKQKQEQHLAYVKAHPKLQPLLTAFPGAEVTDITHRNEPGDKS